MVRSLRTIRYFRIFCSSFLLFLLLSGLLLPVRAASEEETVRHVYDEAGLLTETEIASLEQRAEEYGAERSVSFFIVTTEETGSDPEGFSENFYQKMVDAYGGKAADSVILTIDMGFRYADVSGQGAAKKRLSDSRCSRVYEKITADLGSGNYYEACRIYLDTASNYLRYKPGVNPDSIFLKTWFHVAAAVLAGGCTVAAMVVRVGGRSGVGSGTYLDSSESSIVDQYDHHIRTSTTRIHKPQPQSGGSHSSGGHGGGGGGGGSHGGGHF